MKLWGWPADAGGCAWYRIRTPLESLVDDDVQIDAVMPNKILDEADRLVVLQRSTTPSAMMVLDSFQQKRRPWVYDVDDLLWKLTPDNPAYSHYNQPIVHRRLMWHLANAPLLTVSTPELAEEAIEAGAQRVAVVPNTLPDHVLDLERGEHPDDRTVVFWRGSPTHNEDVKVLRYAMTRLARRDDVRLVFAGTDYRKALGVPDAEFLPWVDSPEAYLRQIAQIAPDIALCPLAHTRFNRSKSHVNALEASAVGAIPVCSNVPAYQRFVTDGVDGVLVPGSEHAWLKTLRELLDSDLSSMQAAARANAGQYRASAMRDQYRDLLASVT